MKSSQLNTLVRSLLFLVIFIILLIITGQLARYLPAKWERFIYGIGGTIAAFFTTWLFLKNERKTFSDIKLTWERGTLYRFLKGLFIGTIIFTLIILLLMVFAGLQIRSTGQEIQPMKFFWYFAVIPLALMEEVAFRSYPFLKLNSVFGLRITQFIIAILFALYHVVGGQDLFSAFLGPGIWAFAYGLAAAWSGGIALPTGIHVAVNVLQPLFGFNGSYQPVWKLSYNDINRVETAGLIIQILILIVSIVLTEYYIRRKSRFPALKKI